MNNDSHDQLGQARAFASRAAEVAADRLKEGSELARERIEAAREQAAETYSDVKDKSYRAASTASRIVTEHPLAVVAGAVAAGALISMLFPRGRAAAKKLGEQALASARSAKDALEHSEFTETVRTRAGETADALRIKAGEAADIARERASEAASAARTALAEADIPGTVRARASEAAEAAREAIEHARIAERAKKLAGAAATKAGDALISVGKRLPRD